MGAVRTAYVGLQKKTLAKRDSDAIYGSFKAHSRKLQGFSTTPSAEVVNMPRSPSRLETWWAHICSRYPDAQGFSEGTHLKCPNLRRISGTFFDMARLIGREVPDGHWKGEAFRNLLAAKDAAVRAAAMHKEN